MATNNQKYNAKQKHKFKKALKIFVDIQKLIRLPLQDDQLPLDVEARPVVCARTVYRFPDIYRLLQHLIIKIKHRRNINFYLFFLS